MPRPAPLDALATHDVLNQPPDLVGVEPLPGRPRLPGLRTAPRRRLGRGTARGTGRRDGHGGGLRARCGREPLPARTPDLRRARAAPRRGPVPFELSRADGGRDASRHPLGRLDGGAARRPRAACGAAGPVQRSRTGDHVPAQHDLRGRAGPAPGPRPGRGMAAEAARRTLRRVRQALHRKARRHARHGDDREAGRLGRPRHPDAGETGRRQRTLRAGGSQVVLLGADVRRLPHPRAGAGRPQLLSRAPRHRGGGPATPST